jgi:hypothetical protein
MRLRIRPAFHWKYSSWVIALSGGAALSAALADKFSLAYFFLFVTACYSIGCWLSSETLASKCKPGPPLYGADGKKLSRTTKPPWLWQWGPTAVLVVLFALFSNGIRGLQLDKELESLSGWLSPAGEHVAIGCPLKHSNDLVLMSGTNAYITDKFPHTAIAFACDDILKIDRDQNGRIGITLTIRDKDGKVVVDLDHGRFDVNKNNYFKLDHPNRSRSTISIVDQYNQQALYLHLANDNVLQFRARFNYRGIPIQIDDLHPFGGTNTFSGSCFGYSIRADVQIGGECLVR